jgi:hypothetical protein
VRLTILRSTGFISSDLIDVQNAVNFTYIMYLHGGYEKIPTADIEGMVRRWFVMSMLTQKYSGNHESIFNFDIRQIEAHRLDAYTPAVIDAELYDVFWSTLCHSRWKPHTVQPYFLVFQGIQVKMKNEGFLSRDMMVCRISSPELS